jgi:hypothetical protein
MTTCQRSNLRGNMGWVPVQYYFYAQSRGRERGSRYDIVLLFSFSDERKPVLRADAKMRRSRNLKKHPRSPQARYQAA